jgi:hypothetical protein
VAPWLARPLHKRKGAMSALTRSQSMGNVKIFWDSFFFSSIS